MVRIDTGSTEFIVPDITIFPCGKLSCFWKTLALWIPGERRHEAGSPNLLLIPARGAAGTAAHYGCGVIVMIAISRSPGP